jgi:hypothetical protein
VSLDQLVASASALFSLKLEIIKEYDATSKRLPHGGVVTIYI